MSSPCSPVFAHRNASGSIFSISVAWSSSCSPSLRCFSCASWLWINWFIPSRCCRIIQGLAVFLDQPRQTPRYLPRPPIALHSLPACGPLRSRANACDPQRRPSIPCVPPAAQSAARPAVSVLSARHRTESQQSGGSGKQLPHERMMSPIRRSPTGTAARPRRVPVL